MTPKEIAFMAHEGQYRRDGKTPYINHVRAVVDRLYGYPQECIDAAWLHDVLEDTEVTVERLRECGVSARVIDIVLLLTHGTEEYMVYLHRIRSDPLARAVKIADMLSNLSEKPSPRQIRKYAQGLLELVTS